jgi:hypothetical protein
VQQLAQNGPERRVVVDHQHAVGHLHGTNVAAGHDDRNRDDLNPWPGLWSWLRGRA